MRWLLGYLKRQFDKIIFLNVYIIKNLIVSNYSMFILILAEPNLKSLYQYACVVITPCSPRLNLWAHTEHTHILQDMRIFCKILAKPVLIAATLCVAGQPWATKRGSIRVCTKLISWMPWDGNEVTTRASSKLIEFL